MWYQHTILWHCITFVMLMMLMLSSHWGCLTICYLNVSFVHEHIPDIGVCTSSYYVPVWYMYDVCTHFISICRCTFCSPSLFPHVPPLAQFVPHMSDEWVWPSNQGVTACYLATQHSYLEISHLLDTTCPTIIVTASLNCFKLSMS